MNFASKISDAEAGLSSAGFVVGADHLWIPEHGPSPDEMLAFDAPHPPQYLSALTVFHHFFASTSKKSWVHLAASMQAGKTGVVTTVLRLMLICHNFAAIAIRPSDVFVFTGMNDDAWKKQTKERLPLGFRGNVQHLKGIVKIQSEIRKKAERNGVLKDVMIIQDESHIACGAKHTPSRAIFDTLCELCPHEKWVENNIRLLTISATDPSAIIGVAASTNPAAAVVKLHTTDDYQSPQTLLESDRLHDTFNLVDTPSVVRMLDFLDKTYHGESRYHILRPKQGKAGAVADALRSLRPAACIEMWDCERKKRSGDDASSCTLEDINELLAVAPEVETFIIIKSMFYAAKTLDDTYCGLLFDRIGHKDDTNLQSLIGRACGYGKSTTTHVFGSLATVRHFMDVWSKVTPTETSFADVKVGALRGKMVGVSVHAMAGGGSSLSVAPTRRIPTGPACGGAGGPDPVPVAPARKKRNDDDFEDEWSPWFDTEDKCIAWWKAAGGTRCDRLKKNDDGFFICSTTASAKIVKKEEIENYRTSGKKTGGGIPVNKESGKPSFRRYVAYTNVADNTSAVFCVHKLTRK